MNTKAIITNKPTEARVCACGTCHATVGPKATYRPGHDARHVSYLLQALVNSYADGQTVTKALINGMAKDLPSEPLRTKFIRAAERLVAKENEAAREAKTA